MWNFKSFRVLALVVGIVLGGMLSVATGASHEQEKAPPKNLVRELKTGLPDKSVISDESDLAKVEPSVRDRILKEVDFSKKKLVSFGWKGSGSEYLTFEVKEADGKITVIVTIHEPQPSTADLRVHQVWLIMPQGAASTVQHRNEFLLPGKDALSRAQRATVKDYLTEAGKLKEKLRLDTVAHVDRSGRAMGSMSLVIEENGEWTQTSSDCNFGIRPPFTWVVAQGKLTPTQLAALAQEFARLPARFGIDAKFNVDVREIPVKNSGTGYPKAMTKPMKIASAEELTKILPDLVHVAAEVDFARQQLLLFAWRGSGQDKLSFRIEPDKNGQVVVFSRTAGQTDDLRSHAHLFVIPKNASWRFE